MRRLLPLSAICFAVTLYAADFWKVKEPNQWSDEEVNKMLTKSPWARSVTIQSGFAVGRGGGDMGGEGGGGGRGGGRDMGASLPSPVAPPIVVRWESATPVQAARGRQQFAHAAQVLEWSKENYVVSLTGFQTRGARRGAPGGAAPGAGGEPQRDARGGGARAGADANAGLPNFRGAVIKHDNKQSFQVDRIMAIRTADGPGLYLLFSRKNAIEAPTKEITVEFAIDATKTQAKFKIKDMEYRGKADF